MTIILIILLIIFYFALNSRITNLEKKVFAEAYKQIENKKEIQKTGSVSEKNDIEEVMEEKEEHAHKGKIHTTHSDPDIVEKFIKWLVKDWLVKLGAFIFLLGAIFFLSIAFTSIGEVGKVSIGFLGSSAIMLFGYLRIPKEKSSGLILFLTGAILNTFVAYTAINFYEVLTFMQGTIISVLISALIMFVALKEKSQSVGMVASLLVFLTPIIFSSGNNDYLSLFIYLLCASVATSWVVVATNWSGINISGILFMYIYSAIIFFADLKEDLVLKVTLLALLTIAIFIFVNILNIFKRNNVDEIDLLSVFLSVLYIYSWVVFGFADNLIPYILLGFSAVFVLISYFILSLKKNIQTFYHYALTSIVFLFISIGYLLEGNALVMVYLCVGLLVSYMTHLLFRDYAKTYLASTALLPSFLVLLVNINELDMRGGWSINSGFPIAEFSTYLAYGFSVIALSVYYYLLYKKEKGWSLMILMYLLGMFVVSYSCLLVFGFGYEFILSIFANYIAFILISNIFSKIFVDVKEFIIAFLLIPLVFSFFLVLDPLIENYFAVALVIAGSLLATSLNLKNSDNQFSQLVFGGASILTSLLIWEVLHTYISSDGLASLIAVSVYAIAGYIVLFVGYKQSKIVLVRIGQIILGLVALRVILIDAWVSGVTFGVFICMVIGAILIATTFVVKDIKIKK